MLNVVAIRGRLSRAAEERILPTSGDRVVGLDLTIRREGAARAESVPVVWHDPPATAAALESGDEVVVVGHVARRFFRAGGTTQSRTEVVARTVLPVRSAKRIATALAEAAAEIEAALPAARPRS
ncbi:MAG: single-stranded DNA-binding protein [Actinomycetota bacterium]|nr:single-stranded DNA-binding protein [Actinomycetota bacterium]